MTNTIGVKSFDGFKSQKLFYGLYEMLDEKKKAAFGEALRKKFDEKITSDSNDGTSFYLTEKDVKNCFISIGGENA